MTVHRVEELAGGVQACVRCGHLVTDYRNVAYLIEDGPPRGYPAGDVTVDGGFSALGALDGAVPCARGAPTA